MKFLSLVFSNLRRKWLRTLLTVLSIVVAFLLYALLGATKAGLSGGVELAGKDRIVVRNRVSIIQSLPLAYANRIQRIPGVSRVVQISWFNGIYQRPEDFFPSHPTVPETFLAIYKDIKMPDDQKRAWTTTRTGAIVGRKTADRFGWKVGQHIALSSPIWPKKDDSPWEFDIVGIFEADSGIPDIAFYFRDDYFEEARKWGEGQIGWYIVEVSDPTKTTRVAEAIDNEFANSSAETKAEPEGVFAQGFAKQIGDIATILIGILGAVFFTILLVAGNTMGQAVRERTGELGVLKALGFTDRIVLFVVLAESVAITTCGGLIGLFLGAGMVKGMAPMLVAMLPNFYLPKGFFGLGLVLMVVLGLLAGIFPALQAGRLRIADALRRGA